MPRRIYEASTSATATPPSSPINSAISTPFRTPLSNFRLRFSTPQRNQSLSFGTPNSPAILAYGQQTPSLFHGSRLVSPSSVVGGSPYVHRVPFTPVNVSQRLPLNNDTISRRVPQIPTPGSAPGSSPLWSLQVVPCTPIKAEKILKKQANSPQDQHVPNVEKNNGSTVSKRRKRSLICN